MATLLMLSEAGLYTEKSEYTGRSVRFLISKRTILTKLLAQRKLPGSQRHVVRLFVVGYSGFFGALLFGLPRGFHAITHLLFVRFLQ